MSKTIAYKTLGCKLNQYEIQALREGFSAQGFREVTLSDHPDYCIFNTCTVTQKADKEARSFIRNWSRNNTGQLIVTGCYAESDREGLERMPGVSLVVGNASKNKIVRRLAGLNEAYEEEGPFFRDGIHRFKDKARAFVKIQDGCNYFCAFCIIPRVRGRLKSRDEGAILREIKQLIDSGFHEIVLSGVCLGSYGRELGRGKSLLRLLERILKLDGNFRIRMSSIDPRDTPPAFADLMASTEKLCPHLHLSLQSGDNHVLNRMKRGYTRERFKELVEHFQSKVPSMGFSTDVIVGFPGEDERAFENSVEFLKSIRFHRVHAFGYSERKGTRALKLEGKVSRGVIRQRMHCLTTELRAVTHAYIEGFLGYDLTVLVQRKRTREGHLIGFTENYIPCILNGNDELQGQLVKVCILDRRGDMLWGIRRK